MVVSVLLCAATGCYCDLVVVCCRHDLVLQQALQASAAFFGACGARAAGSPLGCHLLVARVRACGHGFARFKLVCLRMWCGVHGPAAGVRPRCRCPEISRRVCVIRLLAACAGQWRKNGRLLEIPWGQNAGGMERTVVYDVILLSAIHFE